MATLFHSPPEITREILHYLPISSLLKFGLTSRLNHAIQTCSLSSLRLGWFHSQLGGIISLIGATVDKKSFIVPRYFCPGMKRGQRTAICNQNLRIQGVVDAYRGTLRDLEIALWELQELSTNAIAQLKNLRRLSIRLDHSHTRYSGIDPPFWETSPGSTVWNSLGKASALGRLQSLNLERAGITDYQLAKLLESNPTPTELRLWKCFTLTDKAFKNLAESRIARLLETLHFTRTDNDEIDERILEYIGRLPSIKSLSLHGCHNINSDLLKRLNDEQWHIPDLTLPSTPDSPKEAVEIDDEYNKDDMSICCGFSQHI